MKIDELLAIPPTNRTNDQNRQIARYRAACLWWAYRRNGKRLYTSEIKWLTGTHYQNVYRTFARFDITGPPFYDYYEERSIKKANKLKAGAAELGRNWLTMKEAKSILGVKSHHQVTSFEQFARARGIEVIEIVRRWGNVHDPEDKQAGQEKIERSIYDKFAKGLPVASTRRVGDKIYYLLK